MKIDLSQEICGACDGTNLRFLPPQERMVQRPKGSVVVKCDECSAEYALFIPGQKNVFHEEPEQLELGTSE